MILVALALAAAVLLLYRWRIFELKRKHAAQAAFSRRLIDSQEQERKRFAAELHDGLGQSLVIVKNLARLSLKQPGNQPVMLDHLEKISTTASQAIEETREIAFNLRPHLLDRLGLTRTIESMLDKVFSAGGIDYETRLDPIDDAFANESAIMFYRIVQECASNVVKHAQASQAKVRVERVGRQVRLMISDNGRGFDPSAIGNDLEKRSFGLVGIAERTRLLGGKMRIESEPGKGTAVIVEIELT
jgi:signal transduction histidine kinase